MLYAAEAGSRAWGFASPDSDYDVRFIYCHSIDWYLTIQRKRDVLEFPLDSAMLDVSGWELRKGLQLFLDSNPALYEWLASPTVYKEYGDLAPILKSLIQHHYSHKKLAWHYLRMAEKNYRKYIDNQDQIRLKKYLYVVRPLLALQWMKTQQNLPPISIHNLLAGLVLPNAIRAAIDTLLSMKSHTPELGISPTFPALNPWIQVSIIHGRNYCIKAPSSFMAVEDLDCIFKRYVRN